MRISYCTTCHGRLWQLVQTLESNLKYTLQGEVEICILLYNDLEAFLYLEKYYQDYLLDGRLVVSHREDSRPYTCGYVKNFAHDMARGEIVFNLDADNFISTAHESLLNLKENEILRHVGGDDIGLTGRIGVYRKHYLRVKGYRDVGRNDDGDFIHRLLKRGMRLVSHTCELNSIDNLR